MFGPPVSREVTAQDFVDSWNYVADRGQPVRHRRTSSPRSRASTPTTGYRRQERPYRRQGPRQVHPPGHADVPRSPTSRRRSCTPSRTCSQSTTPRRSAARRSSASRSAPARTWSRTGRTTSRSRWSRTRATGTPRARATRRRPATSTPSTCRSTPTEHRVAGLPEGHARLLRRAAGQRASPPRTTPTSRAAPGRPRPTPSTAVYFISVAMNKPMLGRQPGQPADPRGPQLRRRPQRRLQHRQRGRHDPVGRDRARSRSRATSRASTRTRTIPPRRSLSWTSSRAGGTLPTNIPYWYNTGAGHDKIAQALVAGWTEGHAVAHPSSSTASRRNSYWTQCSARTRPPALFRMGWVADYPSIDNFIYLFTTKGGKYGSYTRYSNPQVDKLFTAGARTIDHDAALRPLQPGADAHPRGRSVHPGVHVPRLPRHQQPDRRVQRTTRSRSSTCGSVWVK